MNSVSSQDQFAKWAKLRRRHDKTMEEYEEMSTCAIAIAQGRQDIHAFLPVDLDY
jgi:hypothetical protein